MTERKLYDKLVRDRIPEIIRSSGAECEVVRLDDEKYLQELLKKLVEEATEALEANDADHLLTELSDVQEVVDAILVFEGRTRGELDALRHSRRHERGGFDERLLLRWTEKPGGGPRRVVCAVMERDGLIFAAKRSASMSLPNKWEFPGGKIEEGESPEEALHREMQEEFAVRIEPIRQLPAHIGPGTNEMRIELVPIHCRLVDETITAREHAESGWFAPSRLKELDWAEADIPILHDFLASHDCPS
jgi:8-oxo-dGTP diphosphatase